MDIILIPLMHVLLIILDILFYIIIANVVISWLFAFGVLNTYNRFVNTIADFLYRVTEPLLGPIRRKLPSIAGIDLSSFVLILAIVFFQYMLRVMIFKISGF